MGLFLGQEIVSHAGLKLPFKIECDALTDEDIETLAKIISRGIQPFGSVRGIPEGGIRLAKALLKYRSTESGMLIVDDVFTTGRSMEEARRALGGKPKGVVIFARRKCPKWITPVFRLSGCFEP